jgi:REP element-mobilizing transposase RayT
MTKKTPHIQSIGEYFHIYNRGVNRSTLFFDDDNYLFFLNRLSAYHTNSEIDIVAFCLMPNHIHLLLRQNEPGAISQYMGRVCKSYAQAINKRMSRSGHLFEGKYKSKLIDDISYLNHLSRYIHRNPVRAKLVMEPSEWKYSSYYVYLTQKTMGVPVNSQLILQYFKDGDDYKDFVESYTADERQKIEKYLF